MGKNSKKNRWQENFTKKPFVELLVNFPTTWKIGKFRKRWEEKIGKNRKISQKVARKNRKISHHPKKKKWGKIVKKIGGRKISQKSRLTNFW